ncbi:ROK family transcriptional regulator [Phytoactinopolyspora limicola]|uniref:ROK family transcriptional regulator n=1 Tax=Phytoactinopolyspora limicola TaxID=2715536 RepID=UPI00140E255C|nr:ROK family protein [Phytoactinopolyspora limicola]
MVRLAGSSKLLRAMNSSTSFALLLDRGPLTRSELRELTGLAMPTVSDVLRRLTEAGLAVVVGHVSAGRGPNAEVYAANPTAGHAAAISVEETSQTSRPLLTAGLCALDGTNLSRTDTTVDLERTDPVVAVTDIVDHLCRQAGLDTDQLRHIQLGVPGSYDRESDTIRHIDIPGFDQPGLVSTLASRLRVDVAVENDVNLAAIAERSHGKAADVDSFALLWFGEGLGLAIDLNGSLLRGARGGAGEIGYLPLGLGRGPGVPDLQDLSGGRAVLALGATYGIDESTPGAVVAAAVAAIERGGTTNGMRGSHADDTRPATLDPAAATAFIEALAARMAIGLAAVAVVLDPLLVVLAGEVARAGGQRLRDAAAAALHDATSLTTPVEVTGVAENPVLLGALQSSLRAVRTELVESLQDATGATRDDPATNSKRAAARSDDEEGL